MTYHDSSFFLTPVGAADVALHERQNVGDDLVGNGHGELANTCGAWGVGGWG